MIEKRRILIVEDEASIRKLFQKILSPPMKSDVLAQGAELFGDFVEKSDPTNTGRFELTLTDCGKAAIQAVETAMIERHPFLAAFIDVGLPGMDGVETAIHIWRTDPDIKIVFATGSIHFDPEEIRRITGRKDISHLRKPFSPKAVRALAKTLVESSD